MLAELAPQFDSAGRGQIRVLIGGRVWERCGSARGLWCLGLPIPRPLVRLGNLAGVICRARSSRYQGACTFPGSGIEIEHE